MSEKVHVNKVYAINYYGIVVVFQVCGFGPKGAVYLVELATKKYKEGIALTENLETAKKPLVVKEKNTRNKSRFKVYPTRNGYLPIYIGMKTELFWEALKYEENPEMGYVLAVPFNDFLHTYWNKPQKIIKEKIIYC